MDTALASLGNPSSSAPSSSSAASSSSSSPARLGQPPRNTPAPSSSTRPTSSKAPAYQAPQAQHPRLWQEEVLFNEKLDARHHPGHDIPLAPSIPPHSSRPATQPPSTPRRIPTSHSSFSRSAASSSTAAYSRPRGLRIANLLRPWTPIILYAITSIGFLVAVAFWKAEVFQGASLTPLVACVRVRACM